jgi:hypothetical protein
MEEFKQHPEKWENLGRRLLEENCKHYSQDEERNNTNMQDSGWCEECGVSEDNANPMINYIYPLELKYDTDDDDDDKNKILEVVQNTNCTVMLNIETDEYFLTLCSGGMDLSQDIAFAYLILEKWIPEDLMSSVCRQKGLSISKENFEKLRVAIIEQSGDYAGRFNRLKEEWEKI